MVFVVLTLVTVVTTLCWLRLRLRRAPTVFCATLSAVAVFQLLAFVHLGFLDPFAPVAALLSLLPCAAVAWLTDRSFRGPG